MTGPIERTTVRRQVLDRLRAQLVAGTLEPGRIYSALTLAEDLGVSATPVREAMLELTTSGLVEAVPNRGFRVLPLTAKDLEEIVSLRLWLEVPAMDIVIARASDEQLAALAPLVNRIVAAADVADVASFVTADRQFHTALIELGGNQRLLRMVRDLRDQTQLLGLRKLSHDGQLHDSAVEHVHILQAVRDRDVFRARELLTKHVAHARGIWSGFPEH